MDIPPDRIGHTLHEVVPHEVVDVLSKHVAVLPLPQLCVPAGQTHSPLWQTVPPEHVLPQVPQLLGSTERSSQRALPLGSVPQYFAARTGALAVGADRRREKGNDFASSRRRESR